MNLGQPVNPWSFTTKLKILPILKMFSFHAFWKSSCSASMINYPETNSKFTPEKWMVGSDEFPFGFRPIFRGELFVLGRVYIFCFFFVGPWGWQPVVIFSPHPRISRYPWQNDWLPGCVTIHLITSHWRVSSSISETTGLMNLRKFVTNQWYEGWAESIENNVYIYIYVHGFSSASCASFMQHSPMATGLQKRWRPGGISCLASSSTSHSKVHRVKMFFFRNQGVDPFFWFRLVCLLHFSTDNCNGLFSLKTCKKLRIKVWYAKICNIEIGYCTFKGPRMLVQ